MNSRFLIFFIFANFNCLFAQINIHYEKTANSNLYLFSRHIIHPKHDIADILPIKYIENKYLNWKENQIVIIVYSIVDIDKVKDWKYGTNLFKIESVTIQNDNIKESVKSEFISYDDTIGNTFHIPIRSLKSNKKITEEFLKSNLHGNLFNSDSKQEFQYIIQNKGN